MTYSMYKMATASVPSGTILAVHLQKCSHLSNEIRVMQNCLHSKTVTYFLTFTGKITKPWFAISLERGKKKKKPAHLPALKNFPILGETNNQFYIASYSVRYNHRLEMEKKIWKNVSVWYGCPVFKGITWESKQA